MGPGRSALDPFPFETAPNAKEQNCTELQANTGIVNYIQGRLERMGRA